MREIKFRGKCKLLGKWMYGSLYIQRNGKVFINSTKVHEETVGQFTGLLDKNGKKIYEGDKVWCRAGEHDRGVWEYEKQFTVEYGWTQEMWEMMQAHEIEVIGNIHDNPELLQ